MLHYIHIQLPLTSEGNICIYQEGNMQPLVYMAAVTHVKMTKEMHCSFCSCAIHVLWCWAPDNYSNLISVRL